LGSGAKTLGRCGGEEGGVGGDLLEFQVQMCPKDSKYHTFKNILGVCGVCIVLKLDRAFKKIFGKLLNEIE
jgi:hypothetical protein